LGVWFQKVCQTNGRDGGLVEEDGDAGLEEKDSGGALAGGMAAAWLEKVAG